MSNDSSTSKSGPATGAKERTGAIEELRDASGKRYYRVRIRLADGTRPRFRVPEKYSYSRERAVEWGKWLQEQEDAKGGIVARKRLAEGKTDDGATVAKWSEGWLEARATEGLFSVADDRSRIKFHVLPEIGTKAMVLVTREDLERLVLALDGKVRAGRLSAKTAQNVWVSVSKMFSDASSSKVLSLRVRSDNPAIGVRPPDRGVKKDKQFLFPTEFLQLVSCDLVPLERRRLYAIAVYVFARASEIKALACDSVDLDRGLVHIHQAARRTGGEVKPTKSEQARHFVCEPTLRPLLGAMHAEQKGAGRIIRKMMKVSELSKVLRRDLKAAGATRAALFANDATRKWMTFHDLRATGLTWMAMRGDSPADIMDKAGHADYSTTAIYVRKGRQLARAFGDVFPPLPLSLLGAVGPLGRSTEVPANDQAREVSGDSSWSRRGSNP